MKRACEEIMLNLGPLEAGMSIKRAAVPERVADAVHRWQSVSSTLSA